MSGSADQTSKSPQTPIRPSRQRQTNQLAVSDLIQKTLGTSPTQNVPSPNRNTTESERISIQPPDASSDSTNDNALTTEQRLRAQLELANAQLLALQQQLQTRDSFELHQSREYWVNPIDSSVTYPGEDSASAARTAYKQRLRAFLCKSPPIKELITGAFQCPIASTPRAIATLRQSFGQNWEFQPKHIKRSLLILKGLDAELHKSIVNAMNANSNTRSGSWNQRNEAIYSVLCSTLDLTKNGKDLHLLEVVDDNNGMALYNLILFRLQDVKTTDPLARAINLKMNLNHIRYVPKPHGVAKYFAEIDSHRTELASLAKPKIIQDWEVVTKALQDLPPLHPKFSAVASMLSMKRELFKQETSLVECRAAFVNAENDSEIHRDLSNNDKRGNKKRKLRVNVERTNKRPRADKDNDPNDNKTKFKKGDCGHHPNSTTHCTQTCMNPFGIRSIFGKAQSYADKCQAVKTSIALGWSPRAKDVKIPQGYGCDPENPTTDVPTPTTTPASTPAAVTVNMNRVHGNTTISPNSLRTYHRVRSLVEVQQRQQPRYPAYAPPPYTTPPPQPQPYAMQHHMHPALMTNRAAMHVHHTATHHGQPQRTPAAQHFPYSAPPPTSLYGHHNMKNSVLRQHVPPHNLQQQLHHLPQPSEDDLIASGMRYFATQAGHQDF